MQISIPRCALFFFVLMLGCASPGKSERPSPTGPNEVPPKPVFVTVLGSSSAAGKNLDMEVHGGRPGGLVDSWANRYAAFLAATHPGSFVRNLAKPGYKTYHALPTGTINPPGLAAVDPERNITAALDPRPDAIIVAFPSLAPGMLDAIIANLHTIGDTAAAEGVPVWIASTQPNARATPEGFALAREYDTRLRKEFGNRVIDFWSPLMNDDGTVKAELILDEKVHPNAEGHRLLFEQVKALDIPAAVGK